MTNGAFYMLRTFTEAGGWYVVLNLLLMFVVMGFMPTAVDADIYLKSEQGKFAVTNNPKDTDYVKVIDSSGEEIQREADQIQEAVEFAAGEYRLPPSLIFSMIRAFQEPEQGLILPLPQGYEEEYGDTILRRPQQNIRVSVQFFQRMLKRYDGNMVLALAAFHAGADAVDRVGGIPSDPEVRTFVQSVRNTFKQLESRQTIIYTYRDQQGSLHVVNIR